MNFIGTTFINSTVCDHIMSYFENENTKKHIGTLDGNNHATPKAKDSLDANLLTSLRDVYINEFSKSLIQYKKDYPMCDNIVQAWDIVEPINIQKYAPGQGFKVWHCERTSSNPVSSKRHLVFMTYLNDVNDGGETEFHHQKILIKPEKGKTLIWPCDWTHVHRGIVSNSQTKYIVTGWISFL